MTLPDVEAAYTRIDKVWRSVSRPNKQVYLAQLARLADAATEHGAQQAEVRDLIRAIRLLQGRIKLSFEPPLS